MIYLLFGAQDLMIKNRLNKMLNEQLGTIDDFNCVRFNLDSVTLEEALFECTLMPLGSDTKAVIIDNANFLSSEKSKKRALTKEDEKALNDYLNHPNEQCQLYFIVHSPNLDEKNANTKKIKEKAKVIESVNPTNQEWLNYGYKLFEKYQVSYGRGVVEEFVNRTNNDALLMTNEVKKLALSGKRITLDNLDLFVSKPLDDKVLNLLNLLLTKNKRKALMMYNDLMIKNNEPVAIISLLATQLRLMCDIFALINENMSQEEISHILKIHPYRVKLAFDNTRFVSYEALKSELEKLYQLDYNIKSGQVDRFFGLEMYILNFNE